MDLHLLITKIAVFLPIFLFAICFHEFAHGYVAKLRGDNTAQMMGRLTLNPMAHADLLGTIIFPIMGLMTGFFFGWAKPVPVNERNLKNPKTDMFWIALAGPLSNVFLALLMVIILIVIKKFFYATPLDKTVTDLSQYVILTNLSLAVFNMIPLHPLDGGKVLARFIPHSWDDWLSSHQFILFILLILAINSPVGWMLRVPIVYGYNLLMGLMVIV